LRPIFSTIKMPSFKMDDKPSTYQDMVVSIPVYKKLVGDTTPITEFWFKYLYIKLKNPDDKDLIKRIKAAFYLAN